jgi:hypothetical protein
VQPMGRLDGELVMAHRRGQMQWGGMQRGAGHAEEKLEAAPWTRSDNITQPDGLGKT